MHSYIRITLTIILLLPIHVLAHGLEPGLRVDPGSLPGSFKYLFERPAEWIDVNLLTLSTKEKQDKKRQLSSERVAEMGPLLYGENPKLKHLETALGRYQYYLESAEDMAEKIIFLDGAEIGIAEQFEEETRLQEKFLRELLEGAPNNELTTVVRQAVTLARLQNEKIFKFMVKNYQFTDADIRKHQIILSWHMLLVREAMQLTDDQDKLKKAEDLLVEAEKHRRAGLNKEGYDLISKAKNIVY